jgi:hypothetical protein
LYDVNLKLIKYVDLDPLQEYVNISAYELKDAVFSKNVSVPRYNDSPYFAGKVSLPYEAKTVAISATVKIQDIPVPKIYPIYGFISQIGVSKIKRYQKLSVYNYCNTEELEFYFKPTLHTFTDTTTANFHVSYCPLNYIARYDNKLLVKGKTGLIDNYNKSNYCRKKGLRELFENLIEKLVKKSAKYIFISYNDEGLLSIEELRELLSKYGKVELKETKYKRFKSSIEDDSKNSVQELLWCLIIH